MSKSVNLRFDGGSVGQQQQSSTPHTIRNLTVRDMIITESGVAYSEKVLCDLDTPIGGEPGFSPVSPEQLAQFVNAGDYIQLDLQAVMDSPESSVYRAFFNAVAFVNTSAGESTSSFNAYVLETDSKKFLNPLEVVFTVASDQLTAIQYLVVYDTHILENTMVHDLILQDSVIVVDGSPVTKHILCDKQHKTGNSFTPVSPTKLATWVSRGDYIALGTEDANDNSTASPLPMTNAVLSDNKCSQITFGGLSDGDTTKFGTGVTIEDETTGIEYIHIDSINVNSAVHDVQYIVIESIDNPPPGLYLSIQTAITNGKIPVIRYDGALYYFDKEYLEDDSPAYSFAGRLDSDEWKTAIRVTSEGVTLGNVLGVNGTVANGVRNSFPLGGMCGIANDDEDYPYLIFEPSAYTYTAKFNGHYNKAYVSNAGETVIVEYAHEITEVQTPYPCLMFVQNNLVSESYNDSGIQLPPGFLCIEDSSGRTVFAERAPVDRIVEAHNYSVILIKNTFSLTPGMQYTDSYIVHGGFWRKESSSQGCNNALAVGPESIASGTAMSAAFNSGKAAGPLSLANGQNALAAAAHTVSLGNDSLSAALKAMAFGYNSMALHEHAMVLAAYGISGLGWQTVLGCYNKVDPDSPFVVGWGNHSTRKNIMRLDQDGNIFTGKRLDLANNIMPLFKLPDSDPASPGTEPVTGYWICDSKKQLVTVAEIVALHAMGMKFVLCENTDPARNSRMYVEQKSVITNSIIDIEFVSADNVIIRNIVVQKETTADVTEASLYIASTTITPVERAWTRQPETVTEGANTYAAVVDGKLTLDVSHSIANVHLKDSNMGGHSVFTINVQTGASGEISDNIVYVVNTCSSGLDVAVKCDNQSHFARGSVNINANRGAYVNINPMYFEVVDAGPVSP